MPGTEEWSTRVKCRTSDEPTGRPSEPCLITSERNGARYVLVDLAAGGVTALSGPPGDVAAHLTRLVGEVATGRWSRPRHVLLVGDLHATAIACLTLDQAREALTALEPDAVLVAVAAVDSAQHHELRSLTASCRAQGVPVVLGWDDDGADTTLPAVRDGDSTRAAPGPVEVAVLGSVEVRGVSGALDRRPKLSELVAYLALHPAGSTTDAWTTALWPERQAPRQTIANRASEARHALGFAPDGRPRLRRLGDRLLLVDVTTDWATFGALANAEHDPRSWQQALDLVRGRPFEGLLERQWCYLDGLVAEMELAIVDVAVRLGRALLDTGDAQAAQRAAVRALRACPFDERLHRLLMRAADAAGSRTGVTEVFRQLALMLEIDGDPRRAVHPETAALYDRLVGNAMPPSWVDPRERG